MKKKKRSNEDYIAFVSKLLLGFSIKMGPLEDEELATPLIDEDMQILVADDKSIDLELEKVKDSFKL